MTGSKKTRSWWQPSKRLLKSSSSYCKKKQKNGMTFDKGGHISK